MSRPLSLPAIAALFSAETGEQFVWLVTVGSEEITPPIRLCSDSQSFTSRGDVYVPAYFSVALPSGDPGEVQVVRAIFDVVDQVIIAQVRSYQVPLTIILELVIASDPDTVLATSGKMKLRNIEYTTHSMQGDLRAAEMLEKRRPKTRFVPGFFPGAF